MYKGDLYYLDIGYSLEVFDLSSHLAFVTGTYSGSSIYMEFLYTNNVRVVLNGTAVVLDPPVFIRQQSYNPQGTYLVDIYKIGEMEGGWSAQGNSGQWSLWWAKEVRVP